MQRNLLTVLSLMVAMLTSTPGLLLPGSVYAQQAPAVVIAKVEREPVIEQVPLSGSVNSPRLSKLSPAIAGLVQQMLVDAGDRVKKGDALILLDDELTQLEVAAAQASLTQAEAALADARRRLEDLTQLKQSQAIAKTEVESRASEVKVNQAAVQQARAELNTAKARLKRHRITAPFDGVVSEKRTEVGEWVTPGSAVLNLFANDRLRIDFPVPQQYFPRVSHDTRLQVRFDAIKDEALTLPVNDIIPLSDPSARTFLVRSYLPQQPLANQQLRITPGMSARASLQLKTGGQELVVSRDALLRHPDGRVTVWVVETREDIPVVKETIVKTGLTFDGKVVITEGLQEDMAVVVEGNEALQQGQRVSIHSVRK